MKDVIVLSTNFESAKLELLLLRKKVSPPLLFSALFESRQMWGMHVDPYETIFVEENQCKDSWDPDSKSNNLVCFWFLPQLLAYFVENQRTQIFFRRVFLVLRFPICIAIEIVQYIFGSNHDRLPKKTPQKFLSGSISSGFLVLPKSAMLSTWIGMTDIFHILTNVKMGNSMAKSSS